MSLVHIGDGLTLPRHQEYRMVQWFRFRSYNWRSTKAKLIQISLILFLPNQDGEGPLSKTHVVAITCFSNESIKCTHDSMCSPPIILEKERSPTLAPYSQGFIFVFNMALHSFSTNHVTKKKKKNQEKNNHREHLRIKNLFLLMSWACPASIHQIRGIIGIEQIHANLASCLT